MSGRIGAARARPAHVRVPAERRGGRSVSAAAELPTALLADDHPSTRLGVRMALEQGGFRVVAEVGTGPDAVRAAVRTRPDICLLDVHMPGGSGIEAAAAITRGVPSTRVVMLTVCDEEETALAALRAGAVGYLLKDIPPERFPAALCGVLRGEAALPRTLMGRVLGELRGIGGRTASAAGAPGGLSPREWEILLLLRDHSTAQIAQRLSLSPVTVRRHVSSAVCKLGVAGRQEALDFIERMTG
jgi:DNA-binding NarL/FixJ family response regulator